MGEETEIFKKSYSRFDEFNLDSTFCVEISDFSQNQEYLQQ